VIKPDGEITNTRDEKCVAAADKWSKNNYRFIQIAFIGKDKPTEAQTQSIISLTKSLQKKYSLPIDSVSAHNEWGPKSEKESLIYWY
jgi:N-acetyl-anhydromuramyl-L-alanine amidase AmpD